MTSDTYVVGFEVTEGEHGVSLFAVTKAHFDAMPDERKALVITPRSVARGLTMLNPQQQGQILHELWNHMSWKPEPERHLGHPTVMEEFVKFVIKFLAEETFFDGRSSYATIEMARTARRIIATGIDRGFRGDYGPHIDLTDEETGVDTLAAEAEKEFAAIYDEGVPGDIVEWLRKWLPQCGPERLVQIISAVR